MYCSQCGCENPDTASFCKSCGKPIGKPVVVAESPLGRPAYLGGSHVNSGGTKSAKTNYRGTVIKLAGVLLIAAVVIGILNAVIGLGFSKGRFTSKQVARDLSASFNQLFSSEFTESSIASFCTDLFDMMPGEAVGTALKEAGISDRSEAVELLNSSDVVRSLSSLAPYLDKIRVDCTFFVGDELLSSDLDTINTAFEEEGISLHVSSGNKLGMSMSVIALDDVQGLSKGETQVQSVEDVGLYVIKANGRWYLWGDLLP